jgi:hypothetical protein
MIQAWIGQGNRTKQTQGRVGMTEQIISESKNTIRELTVDELEAVSGAGLPGAPRPDTCGCPKPTS